VCSGESKSTRHVVEHQRGKVTVKLVSASTSVSSLNRDRDAEADSSVIKKHVETQSDSDVTAAVIALSFGVVLTTVLVLFAACHFCRGRNASWKRRRLHVDGDADYLVDGMYL